MVSTIQRPLPSSREKKRYLVSEVLAEKNIPQTMIQNTLKTRILQFLGVSSAAGASLHFLPTQWNNMSVIKVHAKLLDHVRSALMMITHINEEPVIIRTLRVSGILTKALSRIAQKGG